MANGLNTLASEVMRETGYLPPSTFIGNNGQDARRMVAIVSRMGREIARTIWQNQKRDLTVSVSSTALYALPAGFYQFIGNTGWEGTDPLDGPITSQEWRYYRQAVSATGIYYRFRIFTEVPSSGAPVKRLQVDPVNSATAVSFTFEYQTEHWVVNASASTTFKTGWTTEDDDPTVNQELLALGVKYRWKREKGLDYGDDYADYKRALGVEKAREGGTRKLRMDGSYAADLPNIPETGVGL